MSDILSLLSVLHPHLSATLLRQFCQVVFGLLAMTGRVSMRNNGGLQKVEVIARSNAS